MARVRRARVLTVASRKRLILRCMSIGSSLSMPPVFVIGLATGVLLMKVFAC